jgi:hypothetical protein
LLAVEILSPSTRLIAMNLSQTRFERAVVASLWVVDAEVPSLVAWELRDGIYVEVADVSGDDAWTAEAPCQVTIIPSALALLYLHSSPSCVSVRVHAACRQSLGRGTSPRSCGSSLGPGFRAHGWAVRGVSTALEDLLG